MSNPNTQDTHIPATSDAEIASAQPSSNAAQIVEVQRSSRAVVGPTQPVTLPQAPSSTPVIGNTPLAGALNAKEPMFYIKASSAQLRAIIQSAPADVHARVRTNASKETMLHEIFLLRQKEALNANHGQDTAIDPQEALRQVITMDSTNLPATVDANLQHVRSLMQAALLADDTLMPRDIPDDRHNIIYTILTWQVQAHRLANQHNLGPSNDQPTNPTPVLDTQPPQQPTINQATANVANPRSADHQETDRQIPSITEILTNATHLSDPRDPDDSDEDPELRRKKPRTNTPKESWIEGFHIGANAALEEPLTVYPENRPGANRLNVTSFRGLTIIEKIIGKNMGLQQHVATFPFGRQPKQANPHSLTRKRTT